MKLPVIALALSMATLPLAVGAQTQDRLPSLTPPWRVLPPLAYQSARPPRPVL